MRRRACKAMSLSFFDPAFDSVSMEWMAAVRWPCQSASESGMAAAAVATPAGPPLPVDACTASGRQARCGGGGFRRCHDGLAWSSTAVGVLAPASIPPVTGGSATRPGGSSRVCRGDCAWQRRQERSIGSSLSVSLAPRGLEPGEDCPTDDFSSKRVSRLPVPAVSCRGSSRGFFASATSCFCFSASRCSSLRL